jgi:20S proteasome alpha/beta subunit
MAILMPSSGKLVQIEYALNVVNNGVTALGIKGLLPPATRLPS